MREQIEVLKNHAHFAAVEIYVRFCVRKLLAFKDDCTRGRVFKQIERAEEGGLSAAGRTDNYDNLAFGNGCGNSV